MATGWMWAALATFGQGVAPLRTGDTVVFLGDSITQAGGYVAAIEAYLLSQRPGESYRFVNLGLSSETVNGMSEDDHPGKRPCIHDRFTRDVAPQKPNVAVACYGMNDGNYFPQDPERFRRYQDGAKRLVQRLRQEAGARAVTLLTPPPFDNHRWHGDRQAKSYGYRFPAPDYDRTLANYGAFLKTLAAGPEVEIVDVHGAGLLHLAKRRIERVSYAWAEDSIHPGANGEWVMAQTVLRAWKLAPAWSKLELDMAKAVHADRASDYRWETDPRALPVLLDRAVEPQTFAVEGVADDLARQTIRIVGLPEQKRWKLAFDGEPLGTYTSLQLSAGIGPTDWTGPGSGGERFLAKVQDRRRTISNAFLVAMKAPNATAESVRKAVALAEAATEAVKRRLDEIRAVAPRAVVLTPAP